MMLSLEVECARISLPSMLLEISVWCIPKTIGLVVLMGATTRVEKKMIVYVYKEKSILWRSKSIEKITYHI